MSGLSYDFQSCCFSTLAQVKVIRLFGKSSLPRGKLSTKVLLVPVLVLVVKVSCQSTPIISQKVTVSFQRKEKKPTAFIVLC
jgi:hypothetical protein